MDNKKQRTRAKERESFKYIHSMYVHIYMRDYRIFCVVYIYGVGDRRRDIDPTP